MDTKETSWHGRWWRWAMRSLALAGLLLAGLILYVSDTVLTSRFSEGLRSQVLLRAALYSGNVKSVLQRSSVVPLLLSRDPVLISALQSGDFTSTSQRLISFQEEIGVAAVYLINLDGRVVASSNRRTLGQNMREEPYFSAALRGSGTIFESTRNETGQRRFFYAQKVASGLNPRGVVAVEVDLLRQQELWVRSEIEVAVTDSDGKVILTTDSAWRNREMAEILARTRVPANRSRAFGLIPAMPVTDFVRIDGQRLLLSEANIGFRGWRLYYFATTDDLVAQVNAILALEVMIMALMAAAAFYYLSRRRANETLRLSRESAKLRALNARLSAEVAQRQRAERSLQSAEQSLEQASKLAALGQMSAAVSHELNQPLAAMRTYLAGARLLLRRGRPDEAQASFQRIDSLIERMGAITRQLKSYARRSNDDQRDYDMRDSVGNALAMMAPQLGRSKITITRNMPAATVLLHGDPLRVEQILVNLLRNAVDAVKDVPEPAITLTLEAGSQMAHLSIIDNGHGIDDPATLFEPFATTKAPGEGVGLGLAISAGIATEMGGRLIGRNAEPLGAVFELHLPLSGSTKQAAAE